MGFINQLIAGGAPSCSVSSTVGEGGWMGVCTKNDRWILPKNRAKMMFFFGVYTFYINI